MVTILYFPSSIRIGQDSWLFAAGYYSRALWGCPTRRRETRDRRQETRDERSQLLSHVSGLVSPVSLGWGAILGQIEVERRSGRGAFIVDRATVLLDDCA